MATKYRFRVAAARAVHAPSTLLAPHEGAVSAAVGASKSEVRWILTCAMVGEYEGCQPNGLCDSILRLLLVFPSLMSRGELRLFETC